MFFGICLDVERLIKSFAVTSHDNLWQIFRPVMATVVLILLLSRSTFCMNHKHCGVAGLAGLVLGAVVFSSWSVSTNVSKEEEDADAGLLVRRDVSDKTAVCSDGSPSAFYFRSGDPSRWVIYFEGTQTWCFDEVSCSLRPDSYKSSNNWARTKTWGGLMSANEAENPDWFDATVAVLPSCSSDLYGGLADSSSPTSFGYNFLGWRIVQSTFNDLILKHGLAAAEVKEIAVAGNGGGGVGVLLHLDNLTDLLRNLGSSAVIKGLADTSILVDYPPYNPAALPCTEASNCELKVSLDKGMVAWNAQFPKRCAAAGYSWECYIVANSLHTVETPFLLFQYLYESAQLTNLGVPAGAPSKDPAQLAYAEVIADYYIDALAYNGVASFFTPRCWNHESVMTSRWMSELIGTYSLQSAFRQFWLSSDPLPVQDICYTYMCNPTCAPR
jgi:hypothetical protein